MKEFRTKEMSFKFRCTCINDEYFRNHLRSYYGFVSCEHFKSNRYGSYSKTLFILRSFSELCDFGISATKYSEMPLFVCVSNIY